MLISPLQTSFLSPLLPFLPLPAFGMARFFSSSIYKYVSRLAWGPSRHGVENDPEKSLEKMFTSRGNMNTTAEGEHKNQPRVTLLQPLFLSAGLVHVKGGRRKSKGTVGQSFRKREH